MTKVFKSFDNDNIGYIDIKKLQEVSKELSGKALDQAELEECMKDLDRNRDNMITYDDFRKWWLSGRQGLSQTMRRLLSIKIKALRFMGQISGSLKDLINDP